MIVEKPLNIKTLEKEFDMIYEWNDPKFQVILCVNNETEQYREFVLCNEKRNVIVDYSVSCVFKNNIINFKIEINFLKNEKKIMLLLSPRFKIISKNPNSISIRRNGSFVYVESNDNFDNIEINYILDKNISTDEILHPGTLWLLKPVDAWEIIKFNLKFIDSSILLSTPVFLNDEIDLSRICLIVNYSCGLIFEYKNKDIVLETSLYDRKIIPKYYFNEIIRYADFYYKIMDKVLEVRFISANLNIHSCFSVPGLIIYDRMLMQNPKLLLFTYLFHEINHQMIGNELLFHGKGSIWIKESLTEYIQLIYLRKRFGDSFYKKMVLKYTSIYFKYKKDEIPLNNIKEEISYDTYMCTVASKGVLLFLYAFTHVDNKVNTIRDLICSLKSIKKRISLNDFLKIFMPKLPYETQENILFYIQTIGIPDLESIIDDEGDYNG